MIKRKQCIEKIRQKLSEFDFFIQSSNKSGYFDINRCAEDISKELLNIVYGYNLINLNYTEGLNFPVIDLADENNGTCFQVTANKSSTDLKTIISRFHQKKIDHKYPNLYILILTCSIDQKVKNAIKHTGLPPNQILDFNKVISQIESLGSEGDNIIDRLLSALDSNYFRYTYLDEITKTYKESIKDSFFLNSLLYVEPNLVKELNIRQQEAPDEWDENHFDRNLIKREHDKLTLQNVFKNVKQLVITGNPGTGKSELIKHIFTSLLNDDKKYSQSSIIPIYINLSEKTDSDKIETVIAKELNNYIPSTQNLTSEKVAEEFKNILLKNGALCLLFDGYDELEDKYLKQWNEALRIFLIHYPEIKIVITIRKNRIANDVHLPIQNLYSILPFDDNQLEKYVKNIVSRSNSIEHSVATQIISQIKQWKLNYTEPTIIIKMLVDTALSSKKDFDFNLSKGEIYKRYFEFLVKTKFQNKGVDLPEAKLIDLYKPLLGEVFRILSSIAAGNLMNNKYDWKNLGYECLNKILNDIEIKLNNKYVFDKGIYFFENELKIINSSNDSISFTHYTYQEFFFAYWLSEKISSNSSLAFRWIKSAYIISKYNQIFVFLIGLFSEVQAESFIKQFLKWPFLQKIYFVQAMDIFTNSKYLFLGEIASEAKFTHKTKKQIIDKITTHLKIREPLHFLKACRILSSLEPGSEEIFNKILTSLRYYSHWQRREGLYNYDLFSLIYNKDILDSMKKLLYDDDSYIRGAAIIFFTKAEIFQDDVANRITELNFIENAHNSIDVQAYMVELSNFNPNLCIDFIEKSKKHKIENIPQNKVELFHKFIDYYASVVLNIPMYNHLNYENQMLDVLSDKYPNKEEKRSLIRNLAKSNTRNDVIQNRLIEILDSDEEMAFSPLMYFRDLLIIRPEIIEKAILYIDSKYLETKIRAINYLAHIQYSGVICYKGKNVLLANVIESKLYIDNEKQNESFISYCIEYLTGINYKSDKLEFFLLNKAINNNPEEIFNDTETIIKYLVSVNHFSEDFLKLLITAQTIKEELSIGSYSSDNYFEHIERYVPEVKLKIVKNKIIEVCFMNVKVIFRLRHLLKNAPYSDLWMNEQIERFLRLYIALQKIILFDDERKQLRRLK